MSDVNDRIPELAFEYVDPALMGYDQSTGEVSEQLLWCMTVLTQSSPAPEKTRLVVTGDFVSSVQQRFPGSAAAAGYTTERGDGMVGGKVIEMPDGTVHVLLQALLFDDSPDPAVQEARQYLARRTLVHEVQHVAMRQNDQGYKLDADASWRTRCLTSAADAVLDEYRAELGVPAHLRPAESRTDPLSVLDALRHGLARAVASYQLHQDVQRMVFEAGEVAVVGWKAMAYVAAAEQIEPGSSITAALEHDPNWQRGAARRWNRFVAILSAAPGGTEVLERKAIKQLVDELSELLAEWLDDLGIEWVEERATIHPWYFDDPEFQTTMRELVATLS